MAQGLVAAGQRVTPTILNRIWAVGDGTTHTVTAASFTDLSTVKTITAGSIQVGTAYELICWGNGTWGSTQQALSFAVAIAGTAGNAATIASTAFSASAAFDWRAEGLVLCTTAGASGVFTTTMRGDVGETANSLLPGTAADNTVPFNRSAASVSQDTTVSVSVSIQAKWAATTGAPTLTCAGTLWKKLSQEVS